MLPKNLSQIFSNRGPRAGTPAQAIRIPLIIIISVEIALVFSVGFLSPKLFHNEDVKNDILPEQSYRQEGRGEKGREPTPSVVANNSDKGKENEKTGKRENEKTRKVPDSPNQKGASWLVIGTNKCFALNKCEGGGRGGYRDEQPKAAIIIDDFGNHTETAYALFDLDGPLNCSFLPKRPFTKKSIELAKQKGHQIMLHLPMEPYRSHITNPGNLAVWTYMTDEEIRKTVIEALDAVPGAVGADNHMGSRAMEDERVVTAVLKVFKEQNLFFIDSETTARTVLNKVAKNLGVKTRANRVFLDNKKELSYVIGRIKLLGDIAIRDGEVIGIGHVNTVTDLALKVGIPLLKRRGIQLVSVSELMR